jgi:hypothetical protein
MWWKYYEFMYANGKIRLVETILRRGEIKENDGEGDFKIYCEHFCKCHHVPPAQQ